MEIYGWYMNNRIEIRKSNFLNKLFILLFKYLTIGTRTYPCTRSRVASRKKAYSWKEFEEI